MNKDRFDYLLKRYKEDLLSDTEWEEWTDCIERQEYKELLFSDIQALAERQTVHAAWNQEVEAQIWEKLLKQKNSGKTSEEISKERFKRPAIIWLYRAASVAALLILVSLAGYFFYRQLPGGHKQTAGISGAGSLPNVAPGKQGAILTLANGKQLTLDSLGNGPIVLQQGLNASLKNGQLSYEVAKDVSAKSGPVDGTGYNTLYTPRGRQFQVLLPDGTKVWLNAASSIRYPTAFTGTERKVEIRGEAYFEVAANAHLPFIVQMNERMEIRVLGTHFNVSAYPDETEMHTTLLEGSVRVSAYGHSSLLLPGQQAGVNTADGKATGIQVSNANTEQAVAWKEGLFNFQGKRFEEVMRQLSRWYDIDVVYENGIPDMEFEGELGRDINLSKVLFFLGKVDVHYRLEEGHRLVISR
ncbi:MAG TPA: FecR domain-containing protein [Puia sp.]|nr:FecR domain-containing protein [Puia sp.]